MPTKKLLPKWVQKRYVLLCNTYNSKEFRFNEAVTTLKQYDDSEQTTALVLSEIRRRGWLTVKLDQDNATKRIYKLAPLETYIAMATKNYTKSIMEINK